LVWVAPFVAVRDTAAVFAERCNITCINVVEESHLDKVRDAISAGRVVLATFTTDRFAAMGPESVRTLKPSVVMVDEVQVMLAPFRRTTMTKVRETLSQIPGCISVLLSGSIPEVGMRRLVALTAGGENSPSHVDVFGGSALDNSLRKDAR